MWTSGLNLAPIFCGGIQSTVPAQRGSAAQGDSSVRPVWKGYVSFGLVTIPVKLYAATEEKDVRFRLLHRECQTPIRNQRFCPRCEKVIDWTDVVRGYEVSKGRFVTVTDEEIQQIPLDTSGNVRILGFVALQDIDPLYYERSYYVVPEKGGHRAFLLLREAMREVNRVAVGKVVLREKEHLVALRVFQQGMVLSTLFYADEVRSLSELGEASVSMAVHPNERKMAVQLVQSLATEFRIEEYRDEYREALLGLIQAKARGEPVAASKPPAPGKVVDLMEALRRSVEMAQARKKRMGSGVRAPAGPATSAGGHQRRAAAGGLRERPR